MIRRIVLSLLCCAALTGAAQSYELIRRFDSEVEVQQNGDLIPDPDVELHYPSWMPTAITQCMGFRREKFIERDGKAFVDRHFHTEVSAFLSMWARNIRAQKWAENGRVHDDSK